MMPQYIEVMTSWEFTLSLNLFVLGFIEIQTQSRSGFNLPRLYEKGPCTSLGLFEYYFGITTADCLYECQRRTMCQSVNYNPFNKFCALRDRIDFGTDKPAADWCYNINMTNMTSQTDMTSGLVGPCKDDPCDNTSVCLDLEELPFYTCKKAYCISETNIPNAYFRIGSPTSVGKRNEFVCQQGYMSIGSSSRECLPSGNWSESCFSCVKYCPAIPAKSTASVTSCSTYRFVENTTAYFVCKEGFYNITERKIICDKNGDWSKFDCVPYCRQKDLSPLPNGYPLPGDNYTIYDHAEYACNADFYLSPGSSTVTCDTTAKWSQPEVTCYPFCKQTNIPTVQNGRPITGTMYNFTMTAQFVCDDGYYLSPGSPYIKCDIYGQWSMPNVKCYPYCSRPEPANGYVNAPQQGPFKENESVQYSCSNGYYLASGQTGTAICLNTGGWTYSVQCYKHCNDASSVDLASISSYSSKSPYKENDSVQYSCLNGYYLATGHTGTAICLNTGDWTYSVKCYKHCNDAPSVDLASISSYSSGPLYKENDSVQYSCFNGYYLAPGHTGTAICLNTGDWTYSVKCYKHCNDAPSIANGYIRSYSSGPPSKENDIVTYDCYTAPWPIPSYHLSRTDGKKVCTKDGYWDKTVTCCDRCCEVEGDKCVWSLFYC